MSQAEDHKKSTGGEKEQKPGGNIGTKGEVRRTPGHGDADLKREKRGDDRREDKTKEK